MRKRAKLAALMGAVAMLPTIALVAPASVEYESNAPAADLIAFSDQAEAHNCWGSQLVTESAAEPRAAANNAWKVPKGQGCDFLFVPQQDKGTMHVALRLRVEDNNGNPVGFVCLQVLYMEEGLVGVYQFYGTLWTPGTTSFDIDTSQNGVGVYPYVVLDLTARLAATRYFAGFQGSPSFPVNTIHIWNFECGASSLTVYVDAVYQSTVQ